MRLHLDSSINTQEIHLRLEPDVEVFNATVLGAEIKPAKSGWRVRIETIPYGGGIIELEVEPGKPVIFKSREVGYQLPEIEGTPPRPDWMMTPSNRVLFRDRAIQRTHTYAIGTHEI